MTDEPGRPGASELMRAFGLLVDGPRQWGASVNSRAAGVFVVELPGGAASAPIDISAVRSWIERVPELRLDDEAPTPRDLADFLEEFWQPHEPVLYVGRSTKAVGSRLAAINATPLGDARPSSAGHWLRTLSVTSELRVWWAETEAHEEYEDALLSEVAKRSDGRGLGLPFANLLTSDGRPKAARLRDSLRAPADPPAPASTSKRTAPRPRAARATSASSGPAVTRRRPAASAAQARAAPEPTYLSPEGLAPLQEELHELRTRVRPGVIERVKAARELGDLRENSEYESARKEQSFVEGRIQALEALIKTAVVVETPEATGVAGVGSSVRVEADGEEMTFVLVGSSEADPAAGRISYSSPVGKALMGHGAGDTVTAQLPRGELRYRILEVS